MLTTTELMREARLNSDGVLGFETQVGMRSARVEAVWPEHFAGGRVDNFRHGSLVARRWLSARAAVGRARRIVRAREAREKGGMMPVLSPDTGAEVREEQLETLREVVAMLDRVAAADQPDPPGPSGP